MPALATFTGTANTDTLVGQSGADVINGLGGNDDLTGGGGADTLNGGDGNDILRGDRPVGIRTVTSTSTGVQGNGNTDGDFAVSADGTKIAFRSPATNLIAGDTNAGADLFIRDLTTGAITRVAFPSGSAGTFNANAQAPAFSPDGTKITYTTNGALVAADTNGQFDVYVEDLITGQITLVSQSAAGVLGNGQSARSEFSPDGNSILFDASASTLITGDTNGQNDVFIKNLTTGVVTRVSTDATGAQAVGGGSFSAQFSADGTRVVFQSNATNLVTGDTNGVSDIFVKNLSTGAITRVSTDASGGQATGPVGGPVGAGGSFVPFFSPDGTKIVFESTASNLVAGDTNGGADIFLKDLVTGAVTRLSTSSTGVQAAGGPAGAGAFAPRFSADGAFVVFESNQPNLVAGDTNAANDVFIKNIATGEITRVSLAADGSQGNGNSFRPIFLSDGSVVFASFASNIVPGDANTFTDLFITAGVSGADVLNGGNGDDQLFGDEGNDQLLGGAGFDVADGGTGDDFVDGGEGGDYLSGGEGADRILGAAGTDALFGGNGADNLQGGGENDTLFGEAGGDTLLGDDGDDNLDGGADGDTLLGGLGADRLFGSSGVDLLGGEDGNDTLLGGADGDNLFGGAGNDVLFGETGNDFISGGAGDDILGGNGGSDRLNGDAGADRFLFFPTDSGFGSGTVITDFTTGVDKIDVSLIDANSLIAGDQAFTFRGNTQAPGPAGTMHVGFIPGVGIFLFGYIDGDANADVIINIGTFNITATDIIL